MVHNSKERSAGSPFTNSQAACSARVLDSGYAPTGMCGLCRSVKVCSVKGWSLVEDRPQAMATTEEVITTRLGGMCKLAAARKTCRVPG